MEVRKPPTPPAIPRQPPPDAAVTPDPEPFRPHHHERFHWQPLSGGTREQIAILTRLAFARLLARTGRATPVILDDAVVYADDDHFAGVLDAIAAVAADVQVVLLTCRERAFAELPAVRPVLAATTADAVAAI